MADINNQSKRAMLSKEIRTIQPVLPKLSVILILTSFLFMSCNRDVLFDNTKKIPGDVWKQDEKIRFEVQVPDTVNSYRFFLNIRHSTGYRYANIYFFINSTFPDGTKARDTVECILARDDGKWLGKGITGIRDNQLLLRSRLRFPQQGVYVFEFEQAMREEALQGVLDIGLRLERQ
jgi:gliding motility-associated lipoprotein GldH